MIENGAVRYTICDFLLVGHCKHSSILYTTLFHHKYDMVVEKQAISKKEKYT